MINKQAVIEFVNMKKSSLWYQNMQVGEFIQNEKVKILKFTSDKNITTRTEDWAKPEDRFSPYIEYVFVKNTKDETLDIYSKEDELGFELSLKEFNETTRKENQYRVRFFNEFEEPIDSKNIIFIVYSNRRIQEMYNKKIMINMSAENLDASDFMEISTTIEHIYRLTEVTSKMNLNLLHSFEDQLTSKLNQSKSNILGPIGNNYIPATFGGCKIWYCKYKLSEFVLSSSLIECIGTGNGTGNQFDSDMLLTADGKLEYHYRDNYNFIDITYKSTEIEGQNPSLIDIYTLKFNNAFGSTIETDINILGISDTHNPISEIRV